MIQRILVALSGTPYTPVAIRRAIELAATHQAKLTGVTVFDVKNITAVGTPLTGAGDEATWFLYEQLSLSTDRIEKAIADFEQACRSARIPFEIKNEKGDPLDMLVATSRYHDLIILGLRGLFEYGIVREPNNALARLIRERCFPVLASSKVYRSINKVMIAYDGSTQAAMMMRRFVPMRLWPQTKIVLACFEHPETEAMPWLNDAADYCRAYGFEVGILSLQQPVRKHLISSAEQQNCDLIALGHSGRSLMAQKLFGDTALHMIRETKRPLFIS